MFENNKIIEILGSKWKERERERKRKRRREKKKVSEKERERGRERTCLAFATKQCPDNGPYTASHCAVALYPIKYSSPFIVVFVAGQ